MKQYIVLLIGIFALHSCGDLVDGINQDPNNPTSASYQNILTGAQVGNTILQTGETARRAGIFCGYYTGINRQHKGYNDYSVTTADFNSLWYDAYVDSYRNALEVQRTAESEGLDGIIIGIAQVLQSQIIGTVASLYGDCPFSEAGQIEIENPEYEAQSDVYEQVQDLLDQAIENLESGTGRPAIGSDIYFDGDPDAWREAAYTLKARFYMHTGQYTDAYAAAQNGISSTNNSMYAPHGSGLEESNLSYLFFEVNVRGADLRTSDFLAALIHPDAMASPDFSQYRGNTKTNETARFNYYLTTNTVGIQPNIVDGIASQTESAALVTYQENLLILAEAGFRSQGFDAGLAALNDFRAFMATGGYLSGADLALAQYDAYSSADFEGGGIENSDGISRDDALLREILQERYITLFGQIEGFNDMRRTLEESTVRVPVQPNVDDNLPQRFLYPQTEIDRNSNTPDPIPSFFERTEVNQ